MRNFIRLARVKVSIPDQNYTRYVNTITIQDLRVSFSITKSISWAANNAVVKIWNLSQSLRNAIKNFGCLVQIEAGYRDNGGLQVLYIGYTDAVSHDLALPEIVTTLECSDSARYAIAGSSAKGSVSYAPKTPAQQIIKDLANLMGIALASLPTFDDLVYENGYKENKLYRDMMTDVCNYLGLQASYQNNICYILPLNFSGIRPIANINQTSGMIGIGQRYTYRKIDPYRALNVPTVGYKVNLALNPLLIPGNVITLSSNHLGIQNQPHVIQTIRHAGDTYGPEWVSQMEVTIIQ